MFSIKLIVLAFLICNTTAEWFTSSSHMESLFKEESIMVDNLGHYVEYEESRLGYLQSIADDLEKKVVQESDNFETFSHNPINQYKMLKRFVYVWKQAHEAMLDHNASMFFMWYTEERRDYYPTAEDLNGTITGLIKIQRTYGLPTSHLANGQVGNSSSTAMQAIHCYRIAEVALDSQDYASCIRWLNEAHLKLDKGDNTLRSDTVLILLANCVLADNNIVATYEILREIGMRYPDNKEAADLLVEIKTTTQSLTSTDTQRSLEEVYKSAMHEPPISHPDSPEALCQKKENSIPPNITKSLHCYLWDNNRNPRLLLQPVKVEELWDTPHIVRFYDIISDDVIRNVTEEAKPNLFRAFVFDDSGLMTTSPYRITKTYFLSEDLYPEVAKISRKLADITGFDTGATEELSISNYGTGGFYADHLDAISEKYLSPEDGNRIATVMIYFSDVEQGGHTVFLPDKITVKPIKGSAILWFNMLTTGEIDPRTLHMGCPVITGNKWIGNKWIRQRAAVPEKYCRDPLCRSPYYKMHFH